MVVSVSNVRDVATTRNLETAMNFGLNTYSHIDERVLADRILSDCENYVQTNPDTGRLISVCIGEGPETEIHFRNQVCGEKREKFPYRTQFWLADTKQKKAVTLDIQQMKDASDVFGIIIRRSVPKDVNLPSLKPPNHRFQDIEGMNSTSIGVIVYSDDSHVPCKATDRVQLIKQTGVEPDRVGGRND